MKNESRQDCMKYYLLGRMKNLPDHGKGWRDDYIDKISKAIQNSLCVGPIISTVDTSGEIVDNDISAIKKADIVIANANVPFLLGGPMELVISKYLNKPVITIVDKNSPYYLKNGFHPWLTSFSDVLVENVEDAIEAIKSFDKKELSIKSWEKIVKA
jgi:hypothetical protein